jgi:hypothetical protein
MPDSRSTIADKLKAASKVISNTLADPEVKALVAAYGYDDEMLNEGQQLYDAARAAVSAQDNADGAQKAATESLIASRAPAEKAYQDLAKVVRAVAPPSAVSRLGLSGRMPTAIGDFMKAAGSLFDNAPNLPELSKFGYDAAKLAAERAKIDAYEAASNNRDIAKGAAQQATTQQDAALQALNKWTAQYIKIAKVALNGTQLSEKLGVVARSSSTAAQRAAAAAKKQQPPTPTTTS